MKILVIPDVHGRTFWKKPCENIEEYDKVIFLGDYLDPYDFEKITVPMAMTNFEEILKFANENKDKVVMLLGNHDMPYFSDTYKNFSMWHCRHSSKHHKAIKKLFEENKELFKIADVEDNILFTHAGCTAGWLKDVFTKDYKITSLDDLAFSLNNLLNTKDGLWFLYMVSQERGGRDRNGSCIWADRDETWWDSQSALDMPHDIHNYRQVFGHSLNAYYDENRNIVDGLPVEYDNHKMLDNRNAHVLDTETFEITTINKDS